jgi:hypothetical protein
MKKAQKDRKRQADFTSGSESSKQFRIVKKHTHGSSQSSPSGQWNDLIPEQTFGKILVPKESTASVQA